MHPLSLVLIGLGLLSTEVVAQIKQEIPVYYGSSCKSGTYLRSDGVCVTIVEINGQYIQKPTGVMHVKEVSVDAQSYEIEYSIEPYSLVSIPATNPPGQPHYQAWVTVYRIMEGRFKIASMDGTYVEGGCFEDVPAKYVESALKVEQIAKELSTKFPLL